MVVVQFFFRTLKKRGVKGIKGLTYKEEGPE